MQNTEKKITTLPSNLARKWRSQQFDTIIGQELVVRILKNSLYSSAFFPVYLFSGTRGCGKTTTARVFAAAINCETLDEFQKNPKSLLPCLACRSCELIAGGKHPDFIEIDAASHTGVDHVREIIEAAFLLPIIGRKKIYLIDEAHMLSKAAFNAFLKILEEPPKSVLFVLATTERHKIIETVRSRCFQLFFQPVAQEPLIRHLEMVCERENIVCDRDGLALIVQEADGSVRDALNLLERVRYSADSISRDTVIASLHHIDTALLIDLLNIVCQGDQQKLLQKFSTLNIENFGQVAIWKKLVEILQGLIWLSYGVDRPGLLFYEESMKELAHAYAPSRFITMLEALYQHEHIFLRTSAQSALLQLLLLMLCGERNNQMCVSPVKGSTRGVGTTLPDQGTMSSQPIPTQSVDKKIVVDRGIEGQPVAESPWAQFLKIIDSELEDPLVSSIFKQARFEHIDEPRGEVVLSFSKKLSFFNDTLAKTKKHWEPRFHKIFGNEASCKVQFIQEDASPNMPAEKAVVPVVQKKKNNASFAPKVAVSPQTLKESKKAKTLLQFFPGSLSLLRPEYE